MKEELNYAHLRFFLKNQKEIPMSIMSRETYDELNSYEPMMYRPENWERFNKKQIKEFEWFESQIKEVGYIQQVQKIAVSNHEDFLKRKDEIESEDGFIKWFE